MNTCRLEDLPVELFHYLFSYFSTNEIFSTFTNLTSYIDSILASYTNYRVNFKAISRSHFDLVCERIIPEHVIALTLSDDEDTPGLIGLFLSRFQIHQFTRLQALQMIEIGPDFWKIIVTQMMRLKHLRSFRYYLSNRDYQWMCNVPSSEVTALDKSLFDKYVLLLPQLFELRLNHGDYLHSIQFPHLRHLALEHSNINLIKYVASAAPQLQILETKFSFLTSFTDLILPMPRLNRLVLRIQGKNFNQQNISHIFKFLGLSISMNALEQMMFNLPRLRHLDLVSDCTNDVTDGQRWESIAKNLLTFIFSFTLDVYIESERQLDSFRTSFWLDEKRWFVAYMDGRLFSVSMSKPISIEASYYYELSQYTTFPDTRIFYQHIHELVLRKSSNYSNAHFPNVHTLTLHNPPPFLTIRNVVNLGQIRNMTLSRLRRNFPIKSLINKMPNLCQLSMTCDIENFLKQFHGQVLERIRTLTIDESNNVIYIDKDDIENMFTVFPRLEHLHVDYLCSIEEISDFLHGFKYLSVASFYYVRRYSYEDKQQHRANIQSRLDQIRREEGLDFTYRFDSSRICIWFKLQENDRRI